MTLLGGGATWWNRAQPQTQRTAPLHSHDTPEGSVTFDDAEHLPEGTVLLDTQTGQHHPRCVRFCDRTPEGDRHAVIGFRLGPTPDTGPLLTLPSGHYSCEDRDPLFRSRYSLHVGRITTTPAGVALASHTPQFRSRRVIVPSSQLVRLAALAPEGSCTIVCTVDGRECCLTLTFACQGHAMDSSYVSK